VIGSELFVRDVAAKKHLARDTPCGSGNPFPAYRRLDPTLWPLQIVDSQAYITILIQGTKSLNRS
jgi:hypothetical protein